MNKYVVSDWIDSTGGPFIVMEEAKAPLWNGIWNGLNEDGVWDGEHSSDYDLACQCEGYVGKLTLYGTDVLVLSDEPLSTTVALSDDQLLIVRWNWAESKASALEAIQQIDCNAATIIEKLVVDWVNQHLVLFDSSDRFDPAQCLRFSTDQGAHEVATFVYQPTPETSLLAHSIVLLSCPNIK